MGDIAQRGNRLTAAKGGRIGKFGGGRTNLLEELGRVEAEPSNPNRRAEISRVHGELNRGYAKGGRAGKYQETYRPPQQKKSERQDFSRKRKEFKKGGKPWGTGPKPGSHEFLQQHLHKPRKGKAAGSIVKSVIKAGKKAGKKISDAARKKDTADRIKIFEQAGPHEGAVITKRILGEGTKKGDRTKAAVKDAMEAKPWAGKPHAKGGRAGYAIGSLVHAATKAAKKHYKKKKLAEDTKKGKFPETESLTHQVGPYVGDVGSERPGIKRKRRGWGKKPGQKKPDREHDPYERYGAKKGGKADKN